MSHTELQTRFAWQDIVQDGKWEGFGWLQTCTVAPGRVNIDCIQQPVLTPDPRMTLHIVEASQVTLIEHKDAGFVLREYVARLPFTSVIERLLQVQSTPVHLVAPELLKSLANDGLLAQLFGNQRRSRGQITH